MAGLFIILFLLIDSPIYTSFFELYQKDKIITKIKQNKYMHV